MHIIILGLPIDAHAKKFLEAEHLRTAYHRV